ncbi:hypothetical protein S40288_05996 [Stachybotrys chartarum IBT 40288]|nr:hypothetical protein S40288_05996 [Stachybotrys chartarum IBT 40288]
MEIALPRREMLKALAETREWHEYSSVLITLLRDVIQKGVDDDGDGLSDRETLKAFDILVRRHDNPTPPGSDVTVYGMVYVLLQVDFCKAIASEFDFDPNYMTYGGPLRIYHEKRKDGRNHEEAMAAIPPRHLRPGKGYMEHVEIDWVPSRDDNSVQPGSAIHRWSTLLLAAMQSVGRLMRVQPDEITAQLASVGFSEIRQDVIKLYYNPRVGRREDEALARWFKLGLSSSLTALALKPVIAKLRKEEEEVRDLCKKPMKRYAKELAMATGSRTDAETGADEYTTWAMPNTVMGMERATRQACLEHSVDDVSYRLFFLKEKKNQRVITDSWTKDGLLSVRQAGQWAQILCWTSLSAKQYAEYGQELYRELIFLVRHLDQCLRLGLASYSTRTPEEWALFFTTVADVNEADVSTDDSWEGKMAEVVCCLSTAGLHSRHGTTAGQRMRWNADSLPLLSLASLAKRRQGGRLVVSILLLYNVLWNLARCMYSTDLEELLDGLERAVSAMGQAVFGTGSPKATDNTGYCLAM